MKKISLILILLSLSLNGCAGLAETFFAHYRINYDHYPIMAKQNAVINVGLSKGFFDYNDVGELSYYIAKYIEGSALFNEDLYTREYNKIMVELKNVSDEELKRGCNKIRPRIHEVTAQYKKDYYELSQSVARDRQVEINAMANSLSSMGNTLSKTGQQMQYNIKIPGVSFKPENENKVDHYLINTSSGLRQCRVTSKGYVFCF